MYIITLLIDHLGHSDEPVPSILLLLECRGQKQSAEDRISVKGSDSTDQNQKLPNLAVLSRLTLAKRLVATSYLSTPC